MKCMQWPVLAGMVMFGAVEWTRSLVVATDLGLVLRMALLIAVGAGAYISVMLLVNRHGIAEILRAGQSLSPLRAEPRDFCWWGASDAGTD